MPKSTPARLAAMLHGEWVQMLITAWNKAGWMAAPAMLGNRIARLIGAGPDTDFAVGRAKYF